MFIQDDRTEEQKGTHTWLVIGTDKFLSGWGKAEGGKSFAVWACKPENHNDCFWFVAKRGDMSRVREFSEYGKLRYRPKGRGHCHIYVWEK